MHYIFRVLYIAHVILMNNYAMHYGMHCLYIMKVRFIIAHIHSCNYLCIHNYIHYVKC